ncbi:hydrolase [Pseudomonas sp. ATCC PTA-122608]|uniref:alpha/beta fold hydrolase n=1 Tax=unclassified Pseudomonas TaxID=196821 RepID=UPI00096BA09D|nr:MULTISPECIES: alpha/beta hydrolase [unclassified Pseudomonas]NIL20593.1 alpha/beta hydrolase [Pseudomonas sp. AN3A02]OLY74252.1 hydrolase [Pseudomonas sp. ATCC PTA-122608]
MPTSFTELPVIQGQQLEIRPNRHLSITHHAGTTQPDTVVFFCHGAGGNKDQWRHLWQALKNEGYSLVAWDLLGHGASAKPYNPEAYAWPELVADYLEILKRYSGPRNLIVAHSFGTGLSLSALLANPAIPIEAALLLGTQLNRPGKSGGLMRLPAWMLEWLRPTLAKGFRQAAWNAKADPALVAYEEKLTERNPLYMFKALMKNVQWPDANALLTLTLPVSVLAGDSDGLTPASGGEALARHLPNAEYQLLPECGHQLMLEKPDEVLAAFHRLQSAQRDGSFQRSR